MLFLVAIVENPTKKEVENGGLGRLVLMPTAVIARDAQAAAVNAVMEMDSEKLKGFHKDRLQVHVLPFADAPEEDD